MKQRILSALLALALLSLPLCSALGEPLPWLETARRAASHESAAYVITGELDADSLLALIQAVNDASLRVLFQNGPEEPEEQPAQGIPRIEPQTPWYVVQIPALATLIRECSAAITVGNGSVRVDFSVSGQPWFDMCLTLSTEGRVLLLSDLFPSFAVAFDLPGGMAGDQLADLLRQVIAALPEYVGYPLMEELFSAYEAGLEALAVQGAAQQTEEGVVYHVSSAYSGDEPFDGLRDDALFTLLQSDALGLDPRLARLLRACAAMADANARQSLATRLTDRQRAEQWIEEGAVLAVYTPVSAEINRRYSLADGVLTQSDEEIQYVRNLTREGLTPAEGPGYAQPFSSTTLFSPSGLSYRSQGIAAEQRLTASWSDDEIRADFQLQQTYSGREDADFHLTARLTRDDAGQRAELAFSSASLLPSLPLTIQSDADWNNDATALRSNAIVDWGTGPCRLAALSASAVYDVEAPAAPSLEGRTVFSPADADPAAVAAFKEEIRTVALPKLNQLVVSGLPKDARPLMLPLLGYLATLASVLHSSRRIKHLTFDPHIRYNAFKR